MFACVLWMLGSAIVTSVIVTFALGLCIAAARPSPSVPPRTEKRS
jgi:hypothetical protein